MTIKSDVSLQDSRYCCPEDDGLDPAPLDKDAASYGSRPLAVFTVDRTGLVTSAGGEGMPPEGGDPSAYVGKGIAGLLCPADTALALRYVDAAFRSKLPGRVRITKDGRRFLFSLTPMSDGSSLIVAIQNDVEGLGPGAPDPGEARFGKFFEENPLVMLLFDAGSGEIVDASRAAVDYYGWTIDELRGMRIHNLNPYLQETPSGLASRDQRRNPDTFSFHHRRKDGSIREVDVTGNMFENGGRLLVYAVIHDVTDRNNMASLTGFRLSLYQDYDKLSVEQLLGKALDEAERQTSSGFSFFHQIESEDDSLPRQLLSCSFGETMSKDGKEMAHHPLEFENFWVDAVDGRRTVIVNDPGALRKTGLAPGSHPAIRSAMIVPVVRGGRVPAIFAFGNKPGKYVLEDQQRAEAIVDIAWDIVARKRAENSENTLQSELMQIQKMELVGQLAGGIAHDFNNMLGVIIGHVETALAFGNPDEFVGNSLREILMAAERSAGLTGQLLAFARKQPAMPRLIDLNEAVGDLYGMLRRMIGEEISLSWEPGREAATVLIDPTQVDQILTNLCVNAGDSISGHGSIAIRLHEIRIARTAFEDGSYRAAGEYVVVSVSDTGKGIPRKYLAHVFEPFFTTKEKGKGTGLGLSTVYGIVKQNNGFVELESDPGSGTRVSVYLPKHAVGASSPLPVKADESLEGGRGTILLVEDEPDILKICKSMLEKSGYRLLAASSPREALGYAEKEEGHIDLLLSDVVMPEMNGWELSKKILNFRPGIKTLFMSGYAPSAMAEHGVAEEVNFIKKPFSLQDLTSRVRHVILTS